MFTDPVLKRLVKKYPAPVFEDRSDKLYQNLIREIISQQLSGKAASTIYKRFLEIFGNVFPKPKRLLDTPDETLRACGMSFAKVSYVKSVADAFLSDLIDIGKIRKMSDGEVIATLTQIRGIGRWTAEMTLIFTLARHDVFSFGDLGLRNAIKNLYGITDKKEMEKLVETWKPYRSYACWYLWKSLENR